MEKSGSEYSKGGPSKFEKVIAAAFYGISSILVIFTNKAVLTTYDFPYFKFLAAAQFVVTSLVLGFLSKIGKVELTTLTYPIFKEIMPVTLMFLGNVLCGLGSTKSLSIPMLTVLRRFSIFLTMSGEYIFLNVKPSNSVIISVLLMIGGAIVAAYTDLSFDAFGYALVFMNNIFTALNGVWMKKASMSGKCTKMGVLFYNSLFSAIIVCTFFIGEHFYVNYGQEHGALVNLYVFHSPSDLLSPSSGSVVTDSTVSNMIKVDEKSVSTGVRRLMEMITSKAVINSHTGNVKLLRGHHVMGEMTGKVEGEMTSISLLTKVFEHPAWNDYTFVVMFFVTAVMGSILNYSIFLCTTVNSALTTTVIGAMKNVATTYISMFVFTDYLFSWVNFSGLNISMAGSILYTYVTLFKNFRNNNN